MIAVEIWPESSVGCMARCPKHDTVFVYEVFLLILRKRLTWKYAAKSGHFNFDGLEWIVSLHRVDPNVVE